jgi:hypothetical protein
MENNVKEIKLSAVQSLRKLINLIVADKLTDENKIEFFEEYNAEIINMLEKKISSLNLKNGEY